MTERDTGAPPICEYCRTKLYGERVKCVNGWIYCNTICLVSYYMRDTSGDD